MFYHHHEVLTESVAQSHGYAAITEPYRLGGHEAGMLKRTIGDQVKAKADFVLVGDRTAISIWRKASELKVHSNQNNL